MAVLTHERLLEVLNYDPETGLFRWRIAVSNSVKIGAIAGSVDNNGYRRMCIDGRRNYLAHRLAWFYVHGEWPTESLDHIDCNKINNAIANLRPASTAENLRNRGKNRNNKSGYKGVCFDRRDQRWRATIRVDRKLKHIGYFKDPADAHRAYEAAAAKYHGQFARIS